VKWIKSISRKLLNELLAELTTQLLPICEDTGTAKQESWWLLEKLTNKTKAELLENETITLSPEQQKQLESWITERVQNHKPLQYILGTVPFCDLEIFVESPILIPRPETEEWCAWLISKLAPIANKQITILDLGAGSGCISLALAKALPYATIIGVDINNKAIQLCEKNKKHNNISNAIFMQSDLYTELAQRKGTIDLIVSNPPYIPQKEYDELDKQVTEWEDKRALVASDEGFSIHKKICLDAHKFLKRDSVLSVYKLPRLLIEFGKGQAEELQKIFLENNFVDVEIHQDMSQVERWITASI
jgi:release factor glutamine methyltransferase